MKTIRLQSSLRITAGSLPLSAAAENLKTAGGFPGGKTEPGESPGIKRE